ncbi:MAG: ABC-type antimicrobial peptide transport system, permease component [Planctomycetota bacterium]|nr:ABC-type antimicrobial peptide transport system, permease component [Planctomycetota bacterium]
MIPIKYNIRNLRRRWVTTTLTIIGTGLVVASSCILFGMVEGLQQSLRVSGDPNDLMVLRKGSTNETSSYFDLSKVVELATIPGIARDEKGRPLCAGELVNIPVCERANGSRANLIIRGMDPISPALRPNFKIIEGRTIEPGKGECLVAKPISGRFKGTRLGETLKCGERESYRVVGVFTAGGGAAESEVWVDRNDLARNTQRTGFVSDVQLRAASAADRDAIQKTIQTGTQFNLLAMKESDYYADQQITGMVLLVIGSVIAVLLSIGAMFAAANTMFAAVKSRTREIGTLRALGFSRFDVLLCFLGESILLCSLGGLLGWLATLPMSALTFGTNDFNSFAEKTIQFRFGPLVFAVAFAMTMAMGVFGGLFPAIRAIRLDVIKALREV